MVKNKTSSTPVIKFVRKGWGYEKWIVNFEKYCGKLLFFNAGKKCSWHYHELKDEVFYIQSGKIMLKFSQEDDLKKANEIIPVPNAINLPGHKRPP